MIFGDFRPLPNFLGVRVYEIKKKVLQRYTLLNSQDVDQGMLHLLCNEAYWDPKADQVDWKDRKNYSGFRLLSLVAIVQQYLH